MVKGKTSNDNGLSIIIDEIIFLLLQCSYNISWPVSLISRRLFTPLYLILLLPKLHFKEEVLLSGVFQYNFQLFERNVHNYDLNIVGATGL